MCEEPMCNLDINHVICARLVLSLSTYTRCFVAIIAEIVHTVRWPTGNYRTRLAHGC